MSARTATARDPVPALSVPHARAAQAARDGIAPAFQALCNEVRSLELLIGRFRVAMKMVADTAQFFAQIVGVVEGTESRNVCHGF